MTAVYCEENIMITEKHMRTNQLITSLIALFSAILCSYQSGYIFNYVLNGTLAKHAAGEGLVLSFLLITGGICGLLANIYNKRRFSFLSSVSYTIGFIFCGLVGYKSFPGLFLWVMISGLLAVETGYYHMAYYVIQKSK